MSQWQLEQLIRDLARRVERLENQIFKMASTGSGKSAIEEKLYYIGATILAGLLLHSVSPDFLQAIIPLLKAVL